MSRIDSLEPRLLMTVRTWTGGAALNDKWSDRDNWSGRVAPVDDDELVFPAGIGVLDRGTNNDLPFPKFKSIRFEAGDYKLTGNQITLTEGIVVLPSQAPNTIDFKITFSNAQHVINVASSSRLNLNGPLKNLFGSEGLFIKTGAGVLTFGGTGINSLSQPMRVEQGQLIFQKSNGVTAFAGPLTIGGGLNGPAGEAKVVINQLNPDVTAPTALPNSPAVTINETFDGVGVLENGPGILRIGSLTLKGGRIQGGGTLQLGDTVTVLNSPRRSRLDTTFLDLGDPQRKFQMAAGAADLEILSSMQASANFNSSVQGFIQESLGTFGGGVIRLFPKLENTYKGNTVIRAGRLEIDSPVSGRTVIPGNITLTAIDGNTAELRSNRENQIADTANLRIASNGLFFQTAGAETIGSLIIIENGSMVAGAASLFRVQGKTTVADEGVFRAANRTNVFFEDDVRVLNGTIVADQANITFKRNVILRGGHADTIPSAVDSGVGILFFQRSIATEPSDVSSTISGRLQFQSSFGVVVAHRLDVADGVAANDLVIDAAIEPGSSTAKLFKAAPGRLVMNGKDTASHVIELALGTLIFNGEVSDAAANVTVTQGVLAGSGIIRNIFVNGGTVTPGVGVGLLTSTQVTKIVNAELQIQLNGATPISQHDQLSVGDFDLGNGNANFPTLQVLVNFNTQLNQIFEIVDVRNDSGTVGRFVDLAGNILNEGSTFIAGGVAFKISYVGGDGNDVTLTRVSTPPAFANRSITPTINEGDFVTLSGLITEPDAEDTFFLDVNWGDGTTETFTFAPGTPRQIAVPHRYLDNGNSLTATNAYDVHVSWHDEHGGSKSANLRTVVHNVAPQVSGMAFDSTPVRGRNSILRGLVYDPSSVDRIRLRINWGDGSAVETIELPLGATTFQLTHRFAKRGRHLVRVQAIDYDGGVGRDSRLWIDVVNG